MLFSSLPTLILCALGSHCAARLQQVTSDIFDTLHYTNAKIKVKIGSRSAENSI